MGQVLEPVTGESEMMGFFSGVNSEWRVPFFLHLVYFLQPPRRNDLFFTLILSHPLTHAAISRPAPEINTQLGHAAGASNHHPERSSYC